MPEPYRRIPTFYLLTATPIVGIIPSTRRRRRRSGVINFSYSKRFRPFWESSLRPHFLGELCLLFIIH